MNSTKTTITDLEITSYIKKLDIKKILELYTTKYDLTASKSKGRITFKLDGKLFFFINFFENCESIIYGIKGDIFKHKYRGTDFKEQTIGSFDSYSSIDFTVKEYLKEAVKIGEFYSSIDTRESYTAIDYSSTFYR